MLNACQAGKPWPSQQACLKKKEEGVGNPDGLMSMSHLCLKLLYYNPCKGQQETTGL